MGRILLNEEPFGGGGAIFGTTAPQSSEGNDGDIYCQYDGWVLSFNGEQMTNKWSEPIGKPVDIVNAESVRVKCKFDNTNHNVTVNLSDFYYDSTEQEYDYQITSSLFLRYFPNDLTKMYISGSTGKVLYLYRMEASMNYNTRLKDIFGKVDGEWLKYYPYENYLDKPTGA